MRSRFALLVAAAVVFAPGWQGEGSPEPPEGSDLAARVLAPTVDKGAVRETAVDIRHQLGVRQAKRGPGVISVAATTVRFAALAFVFLWIVFSSARSPVHLFRARTHFSRGPPRLQPA